MWQLLTESLLLALISAAFAFVISRLTLNGIVYFIITGFPPDIGNLRIAVPAADWRVALFLVAGAFVATVLFALGRRSSPRASSSRARFTARCSATPARARAQCARRAAGHGLRAAADLAALFLRGAWSSAAAIPACAPPTSSA